MTTPWNWENPITVDPGQIQADVDPVRLRPGRADLIRARLEFQRGLIQRDQPRYTAIQVTQHGVIIDGHHYVRAAAEEGRVIAVLVSSLSVAARAESILELPLR